jgi:IclR family pca regulon transcriptional regulator
MPMGKETTASALSRVLHPLQETALAMLNVI